MIRSYIYFDGYASNKLQIANCNLNSFFNSLLLGSFAVVIVFRITYITPDLMSRWSITFALFILALRRNISIKLFFTLDLQHRKSLCTNFLHRAWPPVFDFRLGWTILRYLGVPLVAGGFSFELPYGLTKFLCTIKFHYTFFACAISP